jgi:hypothetical protein
MTTLDDLRQVLEEDAVLAPDGAGFLQAAQLGAANVRRRRRLVTVTAAAALVAVIAVVTPIVVYREAGKPVTPAVSPSARKPGDLTLTVDSRIGIPVVEEVAADKLQILTLLSRDKDPFRVAVRAYDPDSPDIIPTAGPKAERTTVQGRRAEAWISDSYARPTLLWHHPSGIWIQISQLTGASDRARVAQVADAVRIGPPRRMSAPFRLGSLPAGLRMEGIDVIQDDVNGPTTTVELAPPDPAEYPGSSIRILAFRRDPDWFSKLTHRTPTTPVAGRSAWYDENDVMREGELVVDGGSCWMLFGKTSKYTVGQLRTIAAGTTFGDCTDQSTWTVPVG